MNLIAVDIGNSNIDIGLFLKDKEQFVKSVPVDDENKLKRCLKSIWEKIPTVKSSKEGKRDGVIVVSSVRSNSTRLVKKIVKEELGEKILIVGKNIPYPIELEIEESDTRLALIGLSLQRPLMQWSKALL
ncbi:MAG: type III pantothenate kinase [Planctomycetota bacterium]|jgi:pantothenate kinase type III